MNEEELTEQGKLLKQVLMQIAIRLQAPYRPFNLSDHLRQVEQYVQEAIDLVKREIRPAYSQQPFLFAEGVRETRGFECEYNRLKTCVLDFYVGSLTEQIPDLARILETPPFAATRAQVRSEIRSYAEGLIIPIIEQFPTAGEDIYLQIYSWVRDADTRAMVHDIAATGIGAPESVLATFGMLGLLINARKAHEGGDVKQAYSYLLDVSHLVGMREGAKSITKNFPELTEKLHKVSNSHKSRASKREANARAAVLFYELRPKNDRGFRSPWPNKAAAATAIWEVMEKEAFEMRTEPGVKFSGVESLCKQLIEHEESGGTLDIDIRWVRVSPEQSCSFAP